MTAAAELVMGELVGGARKVLPLDCSIPGVVKAQQTRRRLDGRTFEERLYECANGWALGARRGGPLHMAGEDTWEIFVLTPQRIANGKPGGWVDEPTLERAVRRLALYREPWQSPLAAGTCAS